MKSILSIWHSSLCLSLWIVLIGIAGTLVCQQAQAQSQAQVQASQSSPASDISQKPSVQPLTPGRHNAVPTEMVPYDKAMKILKQRTPLQTIDPKTFLPTAKAVESRKDTP